MAVAVKNFVLLFFGYHVGDSTCIYVLNYFSCTVNIKSRIKGKCLTCDLSVYSHVLTFVDVVISA